MSQVAPRPFAPGGSHGGTAPAVSPQSLFSEIALTAMVCGSFMGGLGPIGPLLVMGGAAALVYLHPLAARNALSAWPLLLVASIYPLSALWSDQPAVSLRYGLQVATTILAILVAAGTSTPARYVRALLIGSVIILLLCVIDGTKGQSQGGNVLVGFVGSKNAMGNLCLLIVTASLTIMMTAQQPVILRRAAIAAGLLAVFFLFQSFATGALLSLAIFLVVSLLLLATSRMSTLGKFATAILVVITVLVLWFIRQDVDNFGTWFLVDVLGKDTGLTGRDYLWRHADVLIGDRPLIGHGYRAIWLGGGSETIGLLRWADLDSGLGFSFHNTFRDVLVDFGFLGAAAIFGGLGIGTLRLLYAATERGADGSLIFLATMAVIAIFRSYTETYLGAFFDPMLIVVAVSAYGYLMKAPKSEAWIGEPARILVGTAR